MEQLKQKKTKPTNSQKNNLIAKNSINANEIEFDATGKILGRFATVVADALRGKNKACFAPNINVGDKVIIHNAGKIILTGKKLEQKKYYHHTGYLGHLKERTAKDLMKNNPKEIIEKAVFGMLPKNKLRAIWMRNLTINN